MFKFGKITLLISVLFASHARAAKIPEDFQSKECQALFSQISPHPETDALLAWRDGDHRFYQIVEFSSYIPFSRNRNNDRYFNDQIKKKNGFKRLQGISDHDSSIECLGFKESATAYAPRYNSTILDVTLDVQLQDALSKNSKNKRTVR